MTSPHDDQLNAAIREARTIFEDLATDQTIVAKHTETLDELLAAWGNAALKLCPHLGAPRPCFGFLALPGALFCGDCANAIADFLTQTDECDACHHPAETFRPLVANQGPVTVYGWLCDPCSSLYLEPSEEA